MIGVFWNCRGVSKKGMGTEIKNLLNDTNTDFIGLQETMKKKYTDKFFRNIDPSRNFAWHWMPSHGRSRGILCGLKKENFEVISVIEHDFAIEAVVMDKKLNLKMRLGTVYGPTHEEKRDQFLGELATICSKGDLPMIIGGDFNILRYSSEKIRISLLIGILICLIGLLILMV
jgi:mannosylglycoprotein endo-beta-mannosidase